LISGDEVFDQIVLVLGSTSLFVGGTLALILDNTVPGKRLYPSLISISK